MSTMLQAYIPPVYMADDDGEATGSDARSAAGDSIESDESEVSDVDELMESLPEELKDSDDYRELVELRALYQTRVKGSAPVCEHVGYKVCISYIV